MQKFGTTRGFRQVLFFLLIGGFAASAMAQNHTVAFSDETGVAGAVVAVTFTFTNPGGASAVEARARISDVGAFSDINLNNFCAGSGAEFVSCPLNDTNRLVVAMTNFDSSPIPDFTGEILFTIDAAIDPQSIPTTINIEWGDEGLTFTPTVSTDGSIEIVPATSVLSVQPVSVNFGNEFTGSTSAPQAVTIANDGSDGVDLEITNITVSGDFSLDTPSCIGAIISDGNNCLQGVVFSPTSDGPHSGTLTVFSDAGEVLSDTVNLSGVGVPPPTDLVFTVSPHYGVEGGPLFWGVEVQVLDSNGDLYTADNTTVVEISLETDLTGGASLSGNTGMTVVNGVATFAFTDLSIDLVGTGFRLQASDQGGLLTSALSDFFNVVEDQLLRDRFEQ
jgi:hypothetical protein